MAPKSHVLLQKAMPTKGAPVKKRTMKSNLGSPKRPAVEKVETQDTGALFQ